MYVFMYEYLEATCMYVFIVAKCMYGNYVYVTICMCKTLQEARGSWDTGRLCH